MRYKVMFDKYNVNWSDNMEQNIMFLRQQMKYYNDLLRINIFVSLGEILKFCFIEDNIPKEAFLYGWDWGKSGHIMFDVSCYPNGIEILFTAPDSLLFKNAEEYGLENRKENNMKSKSDIPCILIGKKGDLRGVHTVELKIKNVIFNDPATIVFWSDGTKTVVKAGANDVFDPEKGLAMAISKKVLGNNYKAYGRFKKWLPKEYKEPESSDGSLEGLAKAFDNFGKTVKEALENAASEK